MMHRSDFPEEEKPEFKKYLETASGKQCHFMCDVLRKTHPEWIVELLSPLLVDRRDTGWKYWPDSNSKDTEPRLGVRVCDVVAETICHHHPEMSFVFRGDYANLDRQIEIIKKEMTKLKGK